jgi:hypothetical protein
MSVNDVAEWINFFTSITVGTVTTQKVGQLWNGGSIRRRVKTFLFSPQHQDQLRSSPSILFNGYLVFFFSHEVKQPGRDDDHLRPSTAEVKNEWIYTSTAPVYLHTVQRDKFTFTLTICCPLTAETPGVATVSCGQSSKGSKYCDRFCFEWRFIHVSSAWCYELTKILTDTVTLRTIHTSLPYNQGIFAAVTSLLTMQRKQILINSEHFSII